MARASRGVLGWLRAKRPKTMGGPPAGPRPAIVMGLGNPGPKYAGTRHNVGFRCIDVVAERAGISLNDRRKHADLGRGTVGGVPVVLAKPRTFMNASGLAARYLLDRFGTGPERMLVVIDDLDLPLGKIRMRGAGSSGGHRGLDSISAEARTGAYPRLRIGIGRPDAGAIAHVLGGFAPAEEAALAETLALAADAVEMWAEHGVDAAMNRFN